MSNNSDMLCALLLSAPCASILCLCGHCSVTLRLFPLSDLRLGHTFALRCCFCSALSIVMVLWLLLTSCSSLLLRLLSSARPRGISRQSFLVYPLDLHTRVTVAFWVFDICGHLARRVCLHIQFLSVGPRFRYCFFSPAPHGTNLASRYGVRRQLRPLWTFTTD